MMETTLTPARSVGEASRTIFDWLFVVLGGMPFLALPLLWLGELRLTENHPIHWYILINTGISAPHVYATYVRLRRKISEDRVPAWVGFPAYFSIAGLIFLADRLGSYLELLTVIYAIQTFHYLRQGYGVYLYYSRGLISSNLRKLVFYAFHLPMPLIIFGRMHVIHQAWDGVASETIKPILFPEPFLNACWGLFWAGAAVGAYVELRRFQSGARVGITATSFAMYLFMHVFGFVSLEYFQRGFFAVTIYHAIQYLALVQLLEGASAERNPAPSFIQRLSAAPLPLFYGGLLLLALLWDIFTIGKMNQVWPRFGAVFLAAVSAHHYFSDAWIWRSKAGA